MQDKGALILLIVFLIILGIYFGLYGFSHDASTRLGQYAGLGLTIYFTLDELFKE